jgi:hypothetical protein
LFPPRFPMDMGARNRVKGANVLDFLGPHSGAFSFPHSPFSISSHPFQNP